MKLTKNRGDRISTGHLLSPTKHLISGLGYIQLSFWQKKKIPWEFTINSGCCQDNKLLSISFYMHAIFLVSSTMKCYHLYRVSFHEPCHSHALPQQRFFLKSQLLPSLSSCVFDTLNDSLRGTLSSVGSQDGTVCSPASPV